MLTRCIISMLLVLISPAILSAGDVDSLSTDRGWSPSRLVKDTGSGVRLFAADLGALISKPARMEKNDYIWLGVVLGGGAVLYSLDEDIDRFVQRNKDEWPARFIADTGETFGDLGLMARTNRYYFGGIVIGYLSGFKPLQRISTDILYSHWIAGLYRSAFKLFVGRSRPRAGMGAYDFEYNTGGTSMPSGHSSTIMQLATIASHYTDWWPADCLYYGIAGCVCLQRIESREHWASDVWVGALNGIAIARMVMRVHDERGAIWVPTYIPETRTVGLYFQKDF